MATLSMSYGSGLRDVVGQPHVCAGRFFRRSHPPAIVIFRGPERGGDVVRTMQHAETSALVA